MSGKKYQVDTTSGPLLRKIMLFAVPLLCTHLMQLAFHIADMVVVGKFASANALAGVGCSVNICALILGIFSALSAGTSVLAARYFGGKDYPKLRKCVHTSMALALYGGIALLFIGELTAKPMLTLLDTPPEAMPDALTYLRIIFLSTPALLLGNFGSAVLRAIGDTRRPLYFLALSGVVNVLLNLFCVLCLGMGAGGVALATLAAHIITAVLVLQAMTKSREAYQLIWRYVQFNRQQLTAMLKIGVPAAIHSSTYVLSNLLIQSALNKLGSNTVAGFVAAGSLEGLAAMGAASFHLTTLTVIAQNHGAKQYQRIQSGFYYCAVLATLIIFGIGWGIFLLGEPLLWFFTNDPEVVASGLLRMKYLCTTLFICGVVETTFGALRGLGYSTSAMIIPIVTVCGFRFLWVLLVFPLAPTFSMLLVSYPLSWGLAGICGVLLLRWIWIHKIRKEQSLSGRAA